MDRETTPNEDATRRELAAQVVEQVINRRADGQSASDETLISAYPNLMPELGQKLRDLRGVEEAELEASTQERAAAAAKLPSDAIPGYTIHSEIHRGGQGVVYLADQQSTGRPVAVKVMHQGPFHGPHDRARFDREVHVLARLNHPNIVTIHDSGTASGCHYFAMDYIQGRPLNEDADAGVSVREKLSLFAQVCEAIHAAHVKGIIHRDLKPSNIHVTQDGQPHILDFGLARENAGAEDANRSLAITGTGQFIGSISWASPEQAKGEPTLIDIRSDVYSLGVVLFELLTSQFPYDVTGGMRETLANILDAEPKRPSALQDDIDDEVETLLLKCLAKDPERRYQNGGEVAKDIRHYLANEPIEAKRDSTLYILRKQVRRYRLPLIITGAFTLLVIASSVVAWSMYLTSQSHLHETYLGQAKLMRQTGESGRRFGALDVLRKAASIRPSIDVRSEAITAMALSDVRVIHSTKDEFGSTPRMPRALDPTGRYFWQRNTVTLEESVRSADELKMMFTLPRVPREWKWTGVRFRHDGRILARISEAGCELWDVELGQLVTRIPTNIRPGGTPFDFGHQGSEIALGTRSGAIEMVNFENGARRTLSSVGSVNEVRYTHSGDILATASVETGDVVIRDALSGDVLHTLTHPQSVWRIAWSADGSRIGAGCNDSQVYVWRASDGTLERTLNGHESPVSDLGFNGTGSLLFTSGWDNATFLWDMRSGSRLLTVPAMIGLTFCGANRFGFLSDAGVMSFGIAELAESDALHRLVGTPVMAPSDRPECISISPDGRWLVSGTHAGARVWDLRHGAEIAFLPIGPTSSVLFLPHGQELVTVSDAGISRWAIHANSDTVHIGQRTTLLNSTDRELRQSCLSSNGNRLFVASRDQGEVMVFDLEKNGLLRTVGPHDSVRYLAISPDDRWLATGTWAGDGVKIWNLETNGIPYDLPLERDASVAFSPDGKWLVTSGPESIIWQVGSWLPKARFRRNGYASVPGPIAFTGDGTLLAVAKATRPAQLLLIDVNELKGIATLESPGIALMPESISFSRDGAMLYFPDPKKGHVLYAWEFQAIGDGLASIGVSWPLRIGSRPHVR